MGVIDFAGGTVVHITAGLAALMAAVMMRSRIEKEHAPTNIPFVLLGTGLLWFGWFGFNAGSALAANAQAAQAFLTTNTASATAMLIWMFLDWRYKGKPSALGACVGAVVGLVAITPAAGFVSVGASLLIGLIAPTVSYYLVLWRSRTNLDDTLDVFACHGVGGIVGMLATAVFAQDVGLVFGQYKTMLAHIAGLLLVSAYVIVMTAGVIKLIQKFMPLEVSQVDEIIGLDMSEHGETMNDENENEKISSVRKYPPHAYTEEMNDISV
jgi:Amt family ammonium transporter